MKLIFFSTNDFSGMLNLPIHILNHDDNSFYRLGRTDLKMCPPVPISVLSRIPKDSKILYDIFSLDCCVNSKGNASAEKISESEGLTRSLGKRIYDDSFSSSAYFRYDDESGQHTVWLEDTYHTIKKIKFLETQGFNKIGILINQISADTIINLIHTDCCSI